MLTEWRRRVKKIFSSYGCCSWISRLVIPAGYFFPAFLAFEFHSGACKNPTHSNPVSLRRLAESQECFFPVSSCCCGATVQSYVAFIKTSLDCFTTGKRYSTKPKQDPELAGTWNLFKMVENSSNILTQAATSCCHPPWKCDPAKSIQLLLCSVHPCCISG